jgi:hypothetical protein
MLHDILLLLLLLLFGNDKESSLKEVYVVVMEIETASSLN